MILWDSKSQIIFKGISMYNRKFVLDDSSQNWGLADKCREIVGKYNDICNSQDRNNYILQCYNTICNNTESCVEKLFFEKTSDQVSQKFKSVSLENGFERFLEVYLSFGRYGVKSFTNALKNDLTLVK